MKTESQISSISKRIADAPYGSAFTIADFTDIADYETTKKSIARLEKKGAVRRVLRGVYDKPQFSALLQEYAAPDPNQIAEAIAKSHNWTISATGSTALNMLGLSTQVPAKWEYISSGPYKQYQFGNTTINFEHRSDNQLIGMSPETRLLIQAIKAIGRNGITDSNMEKLGKAFPQASYQTALEESNMTMRWIQNTIKELGEAQ